jgi:hypothetical protein
VLRFIFQADNEMGKRKQPKRFKYFLTELVSGKTGKRPNSIRRFLTGFVSGKAELWPEVAIDDSQPEPVFLFALVTPYGGSTALAKILDTSSKSMMLHDTGEAQWFVPGLYQAQNWSPTMPVDWNSVRSVWLSEYQKKKSLNDEISVVIDKSPANVVRAEQFKDNFTHTRFLGFVRNPYATCSSVSFRYWLPTYLIPYYRAKEFAGFADAWLYRATLIKEFVEKYSFEYFTYEQFCADTKSCVDKINRACPELGGIDADAKIKVKNNKVQTFSNQNERRIVKLKPADIKAINSVLETRPDVLKFYGYDLMIAQDH